MSCLKHIHLSLQEGEESAPFSGCQITRCHYHILTLQGLSWHFFGEEWAKL